jgi:site-specific DNA-methyltransferase (cytosine-N4-specific)
MKTKACTLFHATKTGKIYCADSLDLMRDQMEEKSANLILTSPPFALIKKKGYGNVDAGKYLDWFRPFAAAFLRLLKPDGSLVVDIGGTWIPGQPTRSLYHFELLIMLCREFGFHLAQEFFWWNPAKLPTPAEWVTIRRIRVKDAVNCIWWLSPTPWPKASNRRVLQSYSQSMRELLVDGYQPRLRPSGHDISDKFGTDNGGSIPPNLLALAHTESNSQYLRFCKAQRLRPHPARFPSTLPEFFIRMLTDPGDLVFDPFAGSCATGEAAERTLRRWICCDLDEDYLKGALGRFQVAQKKPQRPSPSKSTEQPYYKAYKPGTLWNGTPEEGPLENGAISGLRGRASPRRNKAPPSALPRPSPA